MKRIRKQVGKEMKAFTIIEVVLVLAVAGLIFLVVFSAIPRLQASRRDNQRKRDMEALYSLIIEYESNTGSLPPVADVQSAFGGTTTSSFYDYIGTDFSDPTGGSYNVSTGSLNVATITPGTLRWYIGGWRCSGSTIVTDSSSRGFLRIKLERGHYCIDPN